MRRFEAAREVLEDLRVWLPEWFLVSRFLSGLEKRFEGFVGRILKKRKTLSFENLYEELREANRDMREVAARMSGYGLWEDGYHSER